jgi:RNA polymerase sigma-B factor
MSTPASGRVGRSSTRRHSRYETVRWCDTNALLRRWREDKDRAAREELLARFFPLTRKLAGHYRGGPEPLEDLVQVASLGLLGAIDRFDPARGIPFRAFAAPSILGELKHYYRSTGWSVHVSPEAQELALRVDRAAQKITAHSGRPPRIAELAEQLEITTEDVLAAIATATARYAISLDAPAFARDDEGVAVADSIGAEDDNYAEIEARLSVKAALIALPDRQRQALTLRLDHAMTETEIARQLGCSQMQISRLLHRAAAGLQQLLDPPLSEMKPTAVARGSAQTRAKHPLGASSAGPIHERQLRHRRLSRAPDRRPLDLRRHPPPRPPSACAC